MSPCLILLRHHSPLSTIISIVKLSIGSIISTMLNAIIEFDLTGELALVDGKNLRHANVIAKTDVTCMTLTRALFNELFKNNRELFLGGKFFKDKRVSLEAQKRRISCFDRNGEKCPRHMANFLKRISRFSTEALWNSMYARLYREIILNEKKRLVYGDIAARIVDSKISRDSAVIQMRKIIEEASAKEADQRTPGEHSLIFGLMSQSNVFRQKFCDDWASDQYQGLCRKIRFRSYENCAQVGTSLLFFLNARNQSNCFHFRKHISTSSLLIHIHFCISFSRWLWHRYQF